MRILILKMVSTVLLLLLQPSSTVLGTTHHLNIQLLYCDVIGPIIIKKPLKCSGGITYPKRHRSVRLKLSVTKTDVSIEFSATGYTTIIVTLRHVKGAKICVAFQSRNVVFTY